MRTSGPSSAQYVAKAAASGSGLSVPRASLIQEEKSNKGSCTFASPHYVKGGDIAPVLEMIIQSRKNFFITGKAGTGKTTLLRKLVQENPKNTVVLSYTGVSALNVGGMTIHKFFGFPIDITKEAIFDGRMRRQGKHPKWRAIETMIIDEISVVRADLMDCIEGFLSLYGPLKNQPFGGVQMIFAGDMLQLAPIVKEEEDDIFTHYYHSPYFFSAHLRGEVLFQSVVLEKVYRQDDAKFLGILDRIRTGGVSPEDLDALNTQVVLDNAQEDFAITLVPTRVQAEIINDKRLKSLLGEVRTYEATIKGDFSVRDYPVPNPLELKEGAQVMMIKNGSGYVNGSMGLLRGFQTNDAGEEECLIKLEEGGSTVVVGKDLFENQRYYLKEDAQTHKICSKVLGSFKQFPFMLAWAVTIHKSQGKTFNRVCVNPARSFADGQMYVALSRCRSLEGLTLLRPIQPANIMANEYLCDWHKQMGFS